jgi:hypothetical protein
MKTLVVRVLYRPALILPLLVLTHLMVTLDFSLGQITLVVVAKGARFVYRGVIQLCIRLRAYSSLRRPLINLRPGPRSRAHLGAAMPDGCGCKG